MELTPETFKLYIEQSHTQVHKKDDRALDSYDDEIFPREQSDVADFLGSVAADSSSTIGLLRQLSCELSDRALRWTDMGGGLGVALREASIWRAQGFLGEITLTNVDLFDHGTGFKNRQRLREISAWKGMGADSDFADPKHEPRLIIANAEEVSLPEPADLITSVQAIQYFSDPLKGIANWYNQLSDEGLVVVTRRTWGGAWSRHIIRDGQAEESEVFTCLFSQLDEQDIRYAADYPYRDRQDEHEPENPDPNGIDALVIQKRAGTALKVRTAPIAVEQVKSAFKIVRYDDTRPAIEVVYADSNGLVS